MRKNITWIVVVIATALMQTTWLDAVRLQGVLPDLTLLLVVYYALSEGEERAMFTGLLGGVFQDVASNAVLGHHVLCLVIIGFCVGRMTTRLVTEHPAVKAGLVFVSAVIHGTIYVFVLHLQQPGTHVMNLFATSVIPGAFYSALVTPIVFYIVNRIMKWAVPEGIEAS